MTTAVRPASRPAAPNRRTRPPRVWTVPRVAGALVAALCALAPSAHASTYSTERDGHRVIYRLLEDLGYTPLRVFNVARLPDGLGALILPRPLLPEEVDAARAWAGRGGVVILAPVVSADGVDECGDLVVGDQTFDRIASASGTSVAAEAAEEPSPSPPAPAAQSALRLEAPRCVFQLTPEEHPVAGPASAALAAELSVGDGAILLLSSQDLLTNERLDKDDIAVALRRWLARHVKPGARVAIVEEAGTSGLRGLLARGNLWPLFGHALLWLVLLYWAMSYRFGDAMAAPAPFRRAFALHARALGRLYQRQGAAPFLLKQQVDRFMTWAASDHPDGRVELSATSAADRERLAHRLATRTGKPPAAIAQLLAQVQEATSATQAVDPRGALRYYRLSRALADLQRTSSTPRRRSGGSRGRTARR